ncbi:polysaccharide biosynthesis tyrosine autokinase [Geodermatophilus sp. CPCC 205506]|uniref:polysaccharide biosynthesis tyrosine autokinase n=1 Tax=Geodermatophilus sp. CPCC 205506 TaxID=2936596 RepID=UPI003EE8CB8A
MNNLLRAARSQWWLLLIAVAAGLGLAGALSWLATPLYTSSTQLFVSAASPLNISDAYSGNLFSEKRVNSYARLLTSEQMAGLVIEDLGLDTTPAQLAGQVAARPVPNTVILEATVTDTSPERAQRIAASLGARFTERVTELEAPDDADTLTVRVTTVEPADFNPEPISPRPRRNLAVGALLGLLAGLGLALFRLRLHDARLDETVTSRDDIRELTGVGLMGTVLDDPRLTEKHLVTDFDEPSVTAEAFRAIRTNLQFVGDEHPPRAIVVTSAVPGEGKSTVAVNLATALAQSGSRVALVEADLRRPRVPGYMGVSGAVGLTDVVAGTADLDEVAQPWGDGNLTVLGSGSPVPNPSELLGSAPVRSLLQRLRDTQDYVVIDAPPLLPVTDAAVLSVLADGCVITTRFGHTRREQLAEAAETLARVDATLLGVVLNRVPRSRAVASDAAYGYEPGTDPKATYPAGAAGRPVAGRRRRRFGLRGRGPLAGSRLGGELT